MKVVQQKLVVGTEGKVLIDATNFKSTSSTHSRKRKSENVENFQPSKIIRKDGIYSDPPPASKSKSLVDSSIQTEPTDEAKEKMQKIKNMLTSDEVPSEYWESLAEKRREALEVTLAENKELREENEYLKGENKVLEEMVQEAKHLAALVQEITNPSEASKKEDSLEDDEAEAEAEQIQPTPENESSDEEL